ncbi:lipocalin-like domain-containing protein [Acidovorax sp. NCPPB 4044]|uniref:lipocalin-like domain-containing protein n=1 Tax=Acidovorax sp. NCPPB 4044 TaxID=2940490 RepID=UPI0023038FA9|nr:carotenoid 1,2-hydratase [Acidovorax sp. NCPPB 4044]MDA8519803.1 carotenoid 1,2-hydratase [Acidovorax sp. NCPPB 4044]
MPPLPPLPTRATRRAWLAAALGGAAAASGGAWPRPASALPARALRFPRDHGSHPEQRTEWWYITGHARAGGQDWGFQVTFFRSRVDAALPLRSAFAARHLVFAHAALTDVQGRRLHHDQRIARAGFGVAEAGEADTDVHIGDWSLSRTDAGAGGASRYTARIPAADFALELQFDSTQPPILQGQGGLSRKGPQPGQASYYYSQPQLAVRGTIALPGRRLALPADPPPDGSAGRAWLDHEWSEAFMHAETVGWDWIGMNLQGGSALTAFRLRRGDGSAIWAGGSFRASGGAPLQVFGDPQGVVFTPLRHWTSPRTGARYPVAWRIDTPAGRFEVHALLEDQELDSRGSTGAIYWEGLSVLRDASGRDVGRGYLELTGYAGALRL